MHIDSIKDMASHTQDITTFIDIERRWICLHASRKLMVSFATRDDGTQSQ